MSFNLPPHSVSVSISGSGSLQLLTCVSTPGDSSSCCNRRRFPRHALLMAAVACHPATRHLGILSATYSRGGRSSQNWHNQIKPVFVTGKRMSGGQDCQYWSWLHLIESLLRSCASKPEQLFLLLHSLSHSGSRFQKVGARASGAGEEGIMSSRVNTSGANKAGVDWKGGWKQ